MLSGKDGPRRPEQLRRIAHPTLLVSGNNSPPEFQEATKLAAAAVPSAKVEWVEGGHLIDPAHPAVLAFIDEVFDPKEKP
jgi:esterase